MSTTAPTAIPATPRGNRISRLAVWFLLAAVSGLGTGMLDARAADIGKRAEFHVKYVADGAVYLDAGRNAGLSEGIKLTVKRVAAADGEGSRPQKAPAVIGQVRVVSVAQISAVCEVVSQTGEFQRGDIAYLEAEDAEALAQQSVMGGVRKYPRRSCRRGMGPVR